MLCLLEIAVVVVFGKRLLIIITINLYDKDIDSILLGAASLIKAAGNLVERVSFIYAFRYGVSVQYRFIYHAASVNIFKMRVWRQSNKCMV